MPTIKIGQTTKKINSTKQSFASSTSLSCVLKEPCSMQNPVFQVQGLTKGTMYNYCQFESRYYWVDDVKYLTNNIQEVTCHLDPLATYKSAIGSTKALCAYADWTHWNKFMDDLRFSPEIEAPDTKVEWNKLFNNTLGGSKKISIDLTGCIVMVYIEQTPPAVISGITPYAGWHNGVNTVVMPVSAFKNIIGDLTGQLDNNTDAVSTANQWTDYEFWQGFNKVAGTIAGYGSWKDNILSARYLPIPLSTYDDIGYAETAISIGGVGVSVNGWGVRRIPNIYPCTGCYALNIPWNDVTDELANGVPFLSNSRWASFQVYALGQSVMLDASQLVNQYTITVIWCLDIISGNWNIRLCEGKGNYYGSVDNGETLTLGNMAGTLGMDMLYLVGSGLGLDETGFNLASKILPLMAAGVGAVVGGPAGGIAGSMVGNIAGSFLPSGINATPTPTGIVGANMTSAMITDATDMDHIHIVGKQWKPKNMPQNYGHGDPDLQMGGYCDVYGYPCNDYLTISSCSGYVQCVRASVNGAAGMTEADRTTINGYLNNGFYYE